MFPTSKLIPLFILILLTGASATYLYHNSQNSGIFRTFSSYIPDGAVAIAHYENNSVDIYGFTGDNFSGIILDFKEMQGSTSVIPDLSGNGEISLRQISCQEGIPIYSAKGFENNGIKHSGIPELILKYFGINVNNFTLASPQPGIFVAGNYNSVITSISQQNSKGINRLVDYINGSAQLSFAYFINSSSVETISGNYSSGFLTSIITLKSIKYAVYVALSLQYILGNGYTVLPRFDSVVIIADGHDAFLMLQYNLLQFIFSGGGSLL